jgi:predicted  nucleic acid-binding Zn-ribbon protein
VEQTNYFIGESARANSPPEATGRSNACTVELKTAIRGICADYFESHLSPVVKYMQDSQKQLRDLLDQKVDAKDVPTIAQIESRIAGEFGRRLERQDVASLVRIQELTAAMNRKADVSDVITPRHFQKIFASLEQKVAEVSAALPQKAGTGTIAPTPKHDLTEVSAKTTPVEDKKDRSNDATRIQCLIAAASTRFDRQLRDLKRQVRELQETRQLCRAAAPEPSCEEGETLTTPRIAQRWPGRALWATPQHSDACSDNGSDRGSIADSTWSATPSAALCLSAEEKDELKKIRTLVAAAGTAFSRDIHNLRKKMSEVQDELTVIRGKTPGNRD